MPRPQRPDYDMSQSRNMNITKLLTQEYGNLVQITDPYELAEAVINLATPLVGKGFKKETYDKFVMILNQKADEGLVQLQHYLTNFILRGSGLKVMEHTDPRAIADFITENTHETLYLTEHQKYLKRLVESNTMFKVAPVHY